MEDSVLLGSWQAATVPGMAEMVPFVNLKPYIELVAAPARQIR